MAIRYSEQQAAIHESGHTAAALALELEIDHLELTLVPGENQGWRGHCVLVGDGPVKARFAAIDAFCLAGPICQLTLDPESLDGHADMFYPTLFTRTQGHFDDRGAVINHLRWQGDLVASGIIYVAPAAPWREQAELMHGAKPWLLALDGLLRQLLGSPEVRAFVNATTVELTASPGKRLTPGRLKEIYETVVPPALAQPLQEFVAAQPDDSPQPVRQYVVASPTRNPSPPGTI